MFAYDFSALALDLDTAITTCPDGSGNNRTLTFDATKQPLFKTDILNGLGAALFDSSNDGGYTAAFDWGSNEATFYAIFTSATGSDNLVAQFGGASGNGRLIFYRQNTSSFLAMTATNNGAFSYCVSAAPITTTPVLATATVDLDDANRVQTYINTVSSGAPQNGTTGTANFGTGFVLQVGNSAAYNAGLDGYLVALYGFNVQHDAAAMARVHAYMLARWWPSGFSFGVGDLADNAYSVIGSRSDSGTYVQASPQSRIVVETDADFAMVETYNDLGVASGFGDCGVRIDGADSVALENTASAKNLYSLYFGAKGTTRTIELINGIQSMQSAVRKGSWFTSAFFNGTAAVVSGDEPVTPRIMVYGDSISGGQAAANPSLSGWVQLLRNQYAATGSVISEAWGWRKLKDDCETDEARIAYVSHIATNIAPTIVWLAIGHNDIGAWTAAAFETAYADFLDRLHAALPSAAIYAQTPIISNPDGTQGDFRTAIGNAQSSRSAWCTLVDGTAAAFPQLADLAADGVHLKDAAAQDKHFDAVVAILGL